jgi:hypothetical protein
VAGEHCRRRVGAGVVPAGLPARAMLAPKQTIIKFSLCGSKFEFEPTACRYPSVVVSRGVRAGGGSNRITWLGPISR